MAFDETLATRVRQRLTARKDVKEKKMFGGIAFLLRGNMCVGVHGKDLIVRLDPEATEQALGKAHTRRFDLTGRPIKGWILVEAKGVAGDDALGSWLATAIEYVESLDASRGRPAAKKTARGDGNDKGRRKKRL